MLRDFRRLFFSNSTTLYHKARRCSCPSGAFSKFVICHRIGRENQALCPGRDPDFFRVQAKWESLPAGGATASSSVLVGSSLFQSTLPAGGATLQARGHEAQAVISIHAPRGGSDAPRARQRTAWSGFQSTLPAGGATIWMAATPPPTGHFNPRSPRGERLDNRVFGLFLVPYFNPRSPRGERPRRKVFPIEVLDISIHAPRGGSDGVQILLIRPDHQISIHAPRGGSDVQRKNIPLSIHISIHAPRGGSDDFHSDFASDFRTISIHAPRGGSDSFFWGLSI